MAIAYRFVCDMNDKQDRPYVCSAPGCSQGFHSEDHLVIHRHKHEMTLKFSSIKGDSTFTDQTPTPTRFLRNCEEVGLFKEIEEEFLQAQEEEKNKTLSHNGSSRPHHQPPPSQTQTQQHQQHHQLKPPTTQLQLQHPAAHQPQQHAHHPQPSLHHHPHLHPCLPHAQGQAMMGPSCSLAAPQASQSGSVITTQASSTYSGPGATAGPLPSSLLHMRNRPRQPLPASMPGPLPDPAMQGASAQHMAMDRHGLMGIPGPTHNNPSCASPQRSKQTMGHHQHHHQQPHQHPGMATGGSSMDNIVGHMMGMMSQRQQAPPPPPPPLQHHPSALQAPPSLTYQQRYHAPPPVQLMGNNAHAAAAAAAAHQLHQSPGNVPHPQVHQSPPSHLHQGSPLSIHSQASPIMNQQPSHSHHHAVQPCSGSGSSSSSSSGCGGGGGGGGGRRRRTADQDPDERRQKFLERNRAAATRCRQKRKVWVSALEKKAEELTHTNLQLQNEVTSLRSEVGQLKQILLTHKDCPVTARQRETPGFPTAGGMSPGGSPAPVCPSGSSRLQAVQHNSISTSSPAGGDRGHELHPGH